jgi:SNF2 family DNA or RNA helicase
MLRAVWPDLLKAHAVKSYGDYLARYAVTIETQYGIKVVGVQNTAELREMLDAIMLRRTEDEGLPPLRLEEFWLPFDPCLPQELIDAGVAARDWQDEIPSDAAHATARRMLGARKAFPVSELLAQELEDGAYQKIVVGAYHHGVIDVLAGHLGKYGAVTVSGRTRPEHRRERIATFQNDPRCRVFIGQLTACGTSIDLFAATEVALVEQSWAPDDNWQFLKRVHRTGQTQPVRVRSFMADCELDEGVARVLARKTKLNGAVLY